MKAMVENIPEILVGVKRERVKVTWVQGPAYLKIRPMAPPEAPTATPSTRARSLLTSTADTVPFAGGTGTGAFGAFPRWIADLSGSNRAKMIDDIPVTKN